MKHNIILGTVFVFAFAIIMGGTLIAGGEENRTDSCAGISVESIKLHVPLPPETKIISQKDVKGICETILQIRSEQVSVYATKNFVIAGDMYADRRQMTETTRGELVAAKFTEMRPEMDKAVGLYVPAKGKHSHTLYMFSSPNCPHCHNATRALESILAETNAELKVLFFASEGDARKRAIVAKCDNMSLESYNRADWNVITSKPMCAEGIQVVDKSNAIASKMGISGVPMFFPTSTLYYCYLNDIAQLYFKPGTTFYRWGYYSDVSCWNFLPLQTEGLIDAFLERGCLGRDKIAFLGGCIYHDAGLNFEQFVSKMLETDRLFLTARR